MNVWERDCGLIRNMQSKSTSMPKTSVYFLTAVKGLGKTLTATRIAEEKGKPVLIIAPNALCKQWEEELTNKNEETRITTKDWQVLLCTSKTKKTKQFREKLDSFREL